MEPLENEEVVHGRHSQNRHALLLPQHAGSCTTQAAQHPAPASGRWAATTIEALEDSSQTPPESAMSRIAKERQQEKQSSSNIRPSYHTGHRFGVHGMGGKKKTRQEAPQAPTQQGATKGRDECCDQAMQHNV